MPLQGRFQRFINYRDCNNGHCVCVQRVSFKTPLSCGTPLTPEQPRAATPHMHMTHDTHTHLSGGEATVNYYTDMLTQMVERDKSQAGIEDAV